MAKQAAKQADSKRLQQALSRLHKAVGSVEGALLAGGRADGGADGDTAQDNTIDAGHDQAQGNLGLELPPTPMHQLQGEAEANTATEIKAIEELLNRAMTLLGSDDGASASSPVPSPAPPPVPSPAYASPDDSPHDSSHDSSSDEDRLRK